MNNPKSKSTPLSFKDLLLPLIIYSRSFITPIINIKTILLCFLTLKFNGIILLTNAYEYLIPSRLTTINLFHSFTLYKNLSLNNNKLTNFISYEIQCIIIYIMLFFPLCVFFLFVYEIHFVIKQSKHYTNNKYHSSTTLYENLIYNNKRRKIILKLLSYDYLICVMLSQHFIEVMFYVYYTYISNHVYISNRIVLTVFNSFCVLVINVYVCLFFIFFNTFSLSDKYAFKHYDYYYNKVNLIINIIVFNAQGLHFFPHSNNSNVTLLIVGISLLLVCVLLIMNIKNGISPFFYSYIYFAFILFSLYSGIFSIVITNGIKRSIPISNGVLLLKLICVLLLIRVSMKFILNSQNKKRDKYILKNIFVKNKQLNKEAYLYRLIELCNNIKNNIIKITVISEIIEQHKKECNKSIECSCGVIDVTGIISNIRATNGNDFYIKESNETKLSKIIMIILFIQTEITNYIACLNSEITSKLYLLLLHCEFLFYYRRNYCYCLYLLFLYINVNKNEMAFPMLCQFIALKTKIISKFHKELRHNENNSSSVNFRLFYEYYNLLEEIKTKLKSISLYYIQLFQIKSNYDKKEKTISIRTIPTSNKECNYNQIFNLSMIINTLKEELILILQSLPTKPLCNVEMCYFLSLFLSLTDKFSLSELSPYFLHVDTYDDIGYIEDSYMELNLHQPIIISIKNFQINYITNKLNEILNYQSNEILNKEMHILLPSFFKDEHEKEVKRSIFLQRITQLNKTVFIIDKHKYVKECFVKCGPLPTIEGFLLIVIDVILFPNDNINNKINNNNSFCNDDTNNNNSNDCYNEYLFILDDAFNVKAFSQEFMERYKLSMDIVYNINVNFLEMFKLNHNKELLTKMIYSKLINNSMIVNKDFNNVINIFKHCELKHVLKLLAANTKCDHNNNSDNYNSNNNNIIKTQQNKKYIIPYLDTLKHEIRERHSETDWEHRLLQFQQNIQHEIKNTKKNAFSISIDLHSIGSSCYFQARLHDSELNIKHEFIPPTPMYNKRRVMFQDLTPISRKISSQGFKLFNKSSNNLMTYKKNVSSSKLSSSKSITFYHTTNTLSDSQSNNSLSIYANTTNQRLLLNNSQITLQPTTNNNNNDIHRKPTHKYQHQLTLTKKSKSIVSKLTFIHGNEKEIKDEIQIYHLEKKEHFLIKILFPFLFIFTCCNIINFIFKCSIITSLSQLLRINILIIQIKYHIIETSLYISTACFITDNITLVYINEDVYLKLPTIRNLLSTSSDNLFNYYKDFLSILNANSNENSLKQISEFLYNITEYEIMEQDYRMINMLSSFDHQLHYFHINSGLLSQNASFQHCNVKDIYVYKNVTYNELNNVSYANDEEILMQYIISNVVTYFMDNLDQMISVASKFLDEKINIAVHKITAFNFALIVYGILICVGFYIVVFMYKNSLVLLFRKFFLYTLNPKFKKQLDLFREMLFNFNTEKAIKFETNKNNIDIINNNNNNNDDSEYSFNKSKQSTSNVHQFYLKTFQRQHKLSDNNITNSISNDNAMCDSSSSSNKQHQQVNNNSNSNTTSITFSLCSIHLLISSFICIMFCLLLHLAIMITHTYCDQINFDNLHYAMRLNFYYTDLIPSHNEILLNHRVGIILNDPHFYECYYDEYIEYLPNFDISSKDITRHVKKNKKFQLLGQTQMAFLYFRVLLENELISKTEPTSSSSSQLKLFSNSNNEHNSFHNKFKSSNELCETVQSFFNENNFPQFDGFNSTYNYNTCKRLFKGINDDDNDSSSNSLSHYMDFLQSEYIDYMDGIDRNVNNIEYPLMYLNSTLFMNIYYQFVFAYNPYWKLSTHFIENNMKEMFNGFTKGETVFQIVEILFCVLYFYVYYIVIFKWVKKKILAFGMIIEKLNRG